MKISEIISESVQGVAKDSLPEHIVKVPGGYELRSKHGNKNLGKYPTRAGAEKRERQVQYFKHAK
jgi:predicted kinase